MGLYLCIFDSDEEVEGVEVGAYSDFGIFRDTVRDLLEGGISGSRFPVLMNHPDSDGVWTPEEAARLRVELMTINNELVNHPPRTFEQGWKQAVARKYGLSAATLNSCFFDVDGEPLLERLQGLCDSSVQLGLPILFQ
jgi:hypothetical protein